MLPSGNDSAIALAEYFGAMLIEIKDQSILPKDEENNRLVQQQSV
jgi:D-alanyl-D-alanine carboxypeptidase